MLALALAAAFLVSLGATPLVARAAAARGVFDQPTDRRVHTVPVPRLGGIAVFAAAIVGVAIALTFHGPDLSDRSVRLLCSVLLGGAMMFVTGLVDDLRPLRPLTKLALQAVAAGVVYALGLRVESLTVVGTAGVPLGILSLPLTLLWVVGVTNAFNLIDGLDGLASGIAVVVLGTVLAAALVLGNGDVALVCAALVGAVVGFLPYNVSPARIFLGDSGSLFIGFMLAVLSVYGSFKSTTAVVVAIPLFALAVPLLDTLVAVARRWLRGVPVLSADRRHIHHRLLDVGLSPSRAALALCAVAAVFAVLGLGFAFAPPALQTIALVGGFGTLLLLVYGARRLEYLEFFEASVAVLSGARRVRRVIRDQITAREIGNLLAFAESLVHVNAILEDRADELGFRGLQVTHPDASDARGAGERPRRLWRMEYPVTADGTPEDDVLVLRVTCDLASGPRPYAAERVTRIIAPVIQTWLVDPRPSVLAPPATLGAVAPGHDAVPTARRIPAARRLAGAHD